MVSADARHLSDNLFIFNNHIYTLIERQYAYWYLHVFFSIFFCAHILKRQFIGMRVGG